MSVGPPAGVHAGDLDDSFERALRLLELGDCVMPFTVRAIAALGVADHLAAGPRTVEELAGATQTDARALHKALRALASRAIFAEVEPGWFALTPIAEILRSDHPFSLRDAYRLRSAEADAWAAFGDCIRTGEPAFDRVHSRSYWDHLASHPAESAEVDRSMQSYTRLHLRTVLPAYDWSGLGTVVDAGGGNGAFLAGLLARHPTMLGVLFDLPHVVANAAPVLEEAGVADRCRVVAGSFFDGPLPAGADAYVLKTVLPGFDDERAAAILRSVRAAMRPGSRLLILEAVLPPGDAFDVAKLVDVNTLLLTGGAHRSTGHMHDLLADAGLDVVRMIPTTTLTIVEAEPIAAPTVGSQAMSPVGCATRGSSVGSPGAPRVTAVLRPPGATGSRG